MKPNEFSIQTKLDSILTKCCAKVLEKQREDKEYWGMVGAGVLDKNNRVVYGVNHIVDGNLRDHAEVVAIKKYIEKYGKDGLKHATVITTLSPCSTDIDQPHDRNCTEYIDSFGIKKVYCGYQDPNETHTHIYNNKKFHIEVTKNKKIHDLCKKFCDTIYDKSYLTEVNQNTLAGSEGPGLPECREFALSELKKLKTDFDTIYILGSWYGNLSLMIETDDDIKVDRIINVEMDSKTLKIGQEIAEKLGYKLIEPMLKDANKLDYRNLGKDGLVINQSCNEVVGTKWFDNIPKGTMVLVSGRDNIPKAAQDFHSVTDLMEKYPLSSVLYAGKKHLVDPETDYHIYLMIGIK